METFGLLLLGFGMIAYGMYHIHLYVFRHEEWERRQRVKSEMRNERIGKIVGTVFRVLLGGSPKKHN